MNEKDQQVGRSCCHFDRRPESWNRICQKHLRYSALELNYRPAGGTAWWPDYLLNRKGLFGLGDQRMDQGLIRAFCPVRFFHLSVACPVLRRMIPLSWHARPAFQVFAAPAQ